MKLPNFLFMERAPPSWPWPTCGSPKTLSFRASSGNTNHVFKTINSAFIETNCQDSIDPLPESATLPEEEGDDGDESIEMVIRGLRSERLFFEPGETSSILDKREDDGDDDDDGFLPFKESVTMAVDSNDPFVDFRRSMEEMVEAHGLKDWECLEELLTCYLRVNGKSNHGYIVGAFVDLLVGLAFTSSNDQFSSSSTTTTTTNTTGHSFTSPLSFSSNSTSSTSPCLSILEVDDESEKSILDNASSSSSSCLRN